MPTDPATEPIAEQIVNNLKEKLQGINQVASYQITVKVEDAEERGNATDENKILVDVGTIERNEENGESNRDHYTMIVTLYCLAPGSKTFTTKPRTRMVRMHAAIWKCLREDLAHTLGDLAEDCVPGKGEFGLWNTTPALLLPLTITFNTKQDNPFER